MKSHLGNDHTFSPLPEYPRPDLVRDDWLSLNGIWDFALRSSEDELDSFPAGERIPEHWDGSIVVPFAVETALSGVGKPLLPDETLWYRRLVTVPAGWTGRRVMLRFEAVDYEAAVYFDGVLLGTHRGGYLPFAFELPLPEDPAGSAGHELVVAVRDPGDAGLQQRGKQSLHPAGILYTATSGIWQTVWLEPLPPENSILGLRVETRPGLDGVSVTIETGHVARVSLAVDLPDGAVLERAGRSGERVEVIVPAPRSWSPADPYLYAFRASIASGGLADEAGTSGTDAAGDLDSVRSYFAIRTVDLGPIPGAAAGTMPAVRLNGVPVFLHAVLDQGYWPESGMTAPADEALVFDIESIKALGFNTLRKHVKIESRRFYWHADRLGMLMMQDAVSGGLNRAAGNAKVAAAMILGLHLEDRSRRALRLAGRALQADRDEFENDLTGMVGLLRNHPSIVMWTVFNESWGQFESRRVSGRLRSLDPSRLVDAVSGWHDQGGGDFRSRHTYIVKLRKPPRSERRPYFISEYGGYNLAVSGHLWDESKRFGYRFCDGKDALRDAYADLIRGQLIPMVRSGLRAAVYTQVSDVEIETNGLYTYDREVLKIDADTVRMLNDELYAAFAGTEALP